MHWKKKIRVISLLKQVLFKMKKHNCTTCLIFSILLSLFIEKIEIKFHSFRREKEEITRKKCK